MKGIVFTKLQKMIEEGFGLETWDQLIELTQPKSGGAYTAGESYPDSELYKIVESLSNFSKTSQERLIFAFGEFLLLNLVKLYPGFVRDKNLKTFLLSVDQIVHVEVKKIYPDANLPKFDYEDTDPNELVMIYSSDRKLCKLAEGLIAGAAKHFKQSYKLTHPKCLLHGQEHCRLEIEFS